MDARDVLIAREELPGWLRVTEGLWLPMRVPGKVLFEEVVNPKAETYIVHHQSGAIVFKACSPASKAIHLLHHGQIIVGLDRRDGMIHIVQPVRGWVSLELPNGEAVLMMYDPAVNAMSDTTTSIVPTEESEVIPVVVESESESEEGPNMHTHDDHVPAKNFQDILNESVEQSGSDAKEDSLTEGAVPRADGGDWTDKPMNLQDAMRASMVHKEEKDRMKAERELKATLAPTPKQTSPLRMLSAPVDLTDSNVGGFPSLPGTEMPETQTSAPDNIQTWEELEERYWKDLETNRRANVELAKQLDDEGAEKTGVEVSTQVDAWGAIGKFQWVSGLEEHFGNLRDGLVYVLVSLPLGEYDRGDELVLEDGEQARVIANPKTEEGMWVLRCETENQDLFKAADAGEFRKAATTAAVSTSVTSQQSASVPVKYGKFVTDIRAGINLQKVAKKRTPKSRQKSDAPKDGDEKQEHGTHTPQLGPPPPRKSIQLKDGENTGFAGFGLAALSGMATISKGGRPRSKYDGVSWQDLTEKWAAELVVDGLAKKQFLGSYKSEEMAAAIVFTARKMEAEGKFFEWLTQLKRGPELKKKIYHDLLEVGRLIKECKTARNRVRGERNLPMPPATKVGAVTGWKVYLDGLNLRWADLQELKQVRKDAATERLALAPYLQKPELGDNTDRVPAKPPKVEWAELQNWKDYLQKMQVLRQELIDLGDIKSDTSHLLEQIEPLLEDDEDPPDPPASINNLQAWKTYHETLARFHTSMLDRRERLILEEKQEDEAREQATISARRSKYKNNYDDKNKEEDDPESTTSSRSAMTKRPTAVFKSTMEEAAAEQAYHVRSWHVEDVCLWLSQARLDRYQNEFIKVKIDGRKLMSDWFMDWLEKCKVVNSLHKKKFKRLLNKMKYPDM